MNKFAHFYLGEMEKRAANPWWGALANAGAASGISYGVGSAMGLDPGEKAVAAGVAGVLGARSGHAIGSAWKSPRVNAAGKAISVTRGGGPMSFGEAVNKNWGKATSSLMGDFVAAPTVVGVKGFLKEQKLDNALKEHELAVLQKDPTSKPEFFGPPAPAPAPAPASVTNINTPAKQDVNLIPGGDVGKWALGLTAMGLSAAGIYALTQIARVNKRKADGKEPPPVTNVNVAGGGGGDGTPSAPGAPGAPSAGTLRVTLPTRNHKDHETQVEMPLEQIGLSKTLIAKIRRDTKRRLRGESDARTHHIIPPARDVIKTGEFLETVRGLMKQAEAK